MTAAPLFTAEQLAVRADPPAERIQRRIRTKAIPGAGMTLAKRHPEWGRLDQGAVVHRVDELVIVWTTTPPSWGVRWACGNGSVAPLLLTDLAPGLDVCEDCRFPPSVVYYALRDDLIKIGFTKQPRKRMRALRAELMAWEPGGRSEELRRHQQFASHRVDGEWFEPAPDLLSHIELLMDQEASK